jgi:hypothetical protein
MGPIGENGSQIWVPLETRGKDKLGAIAPISGPRRGSEGPFRIRGRQHRCDGRRREDRGAFVDKTEFCRAGNKHHAASVPPDMLRRAAMALRECPSGDIFRLARVALEAAIRSESDLDRAASSRPGRDVRYAPTNRRSQRRRLGPFCAKKRSRR